MKKQAWVKVLSVLLAAVLALTVPVISVYGQVNEDPPINRPMDEYDDRNSKK